MDFPDPQAILARMTAEEIEAPPVSTIAAAAAGRGALLVGSITGAADPQCLASARVRLVVQCAAEHAGRVSPAGCASAAALSGGPVEVLELDLCDEDHYALAPSFDRALPLIASARARGDGVLISCAAGRSRSVSVAAAHLVSWEAMSLARALAVIQTARPAACPNVGFIVQLMAFETRQRGVCSVPPSAVRAHPLYKVVFDDDEAGQAYITHKLGGPAPPPALALPPEPPAEGEGTFSPTEDGMHRFKSFYWQHQRPQARTRAGSNALAAAGSDLDAVVDPKS